jgi:hypothetical protein
MRISKIAVLILVTLMAGTVLADQELSRYSDVPQGTQPAVWVGGPTTAGESVRALAFWTDRTLFDAAFPGLPTEDWSGTSVAAGAISSCTPPLNSTTNDACFATGTVLPGIELAVNVTTGGGDYVVIGAGAFGNTNVIVGPNSFVDNLVLNFNPAVRAVGFDVVNPLTPGVTYTVEIFGPGGSLGTTTVTDGSEGNFWGVDSTDVGGITSIVFDGGALSDHSELTTLVSFGGTPVPVELQSLSIE